MMHPTSTPIPNPNTLNFIHFGVPSQSPRYQNFLEKVRLAAFSTIPVHIYGETGSGKEIIAKTLHANSPYKDGPLVSVNCGALSDDLLQSELFGYAGGAFTGASPKGFNGKIRQANQGTLFLDEVNSMSSKLQSALLRVLEDNWVMPIGSDKRQNVNFRLITASNQPLPQLVEQGRFRLDLFYRIYVCVLSVPPLRERLEDLQPLVTRFCTTKHWQIDWEAALLTVAKTHPWPGNIREFENFLERLYLYYRQTTPTISQITALLDQMTFPTDLTATPQTAANSYLENSEKKHLIEVLIKNNYRLMATADALGISRSTLYRKLKKYQLTTK